MTLTGKTALVTGGSRGIGRAVVEDLAASGARVVFTYRRDEAAAEKVVAETPGAVAVRADQEDLGSLGAIFDQAAISGPLSCEQAGYRRRMADDSSQPAPGLQST